MLFRFRICQFNERPDSAHGWIMASSEQHAKSILGEFASVSRVAIRDDLAIPNGTVFVTDGRLEG